ncbi:MAG: Intracellular proteinase inhibitor [Verrucomicrobiota bacterium]
MRCVLLGSLVLVLSWSLAPLAEAQAPVSAPLGQSSPEPRGPIAALKRGWSEVTEGARWAGKTVARPVEWIFKRKAQAPKSLLEIQMRIEPPNPSLARDRQIRAVLTLQNPSKHAQVLHFSTTQRADAVIRDASGKVVSRASEDRSFEKSEALVTVNPGERLELELALATRDLTVGRVYTLDAAVSEQDSLRVQKSLSVGP